MEFEFLKEKIWNQIWNFCKILGVSTVLPYDLYERMNQKLKGIGVYKD